MGFNYTPPKEFYLLFVKYIPNPIIAAIIIPALNINHPTLIASKV